MFTQHQNVNLYFEIFLVNNTNLFKFFFVKMVVFYILLVLTVVLAWFSNITYLIILKKYV